MWTSSPTRASFFARNLSIGDENTHVLEGPDGGHRLDSVGAAAAAVWQPGYRQITWRITSDGIDVGFGSGCTWRVIGVPEHEWRAAGRPLDEWLGLPVSERLSFDSQDLWRVPGVVDRVTSLKCGGADNQSNMQWQTKGAAKEKDKWE